MLKSRRVIGREFCKLIRAGLLPKVAILELVRKYNCSRASIYRCVREVKK